MLALKRIVFSISISVLATGIAMAQATAELVGKVSDPSGAGVVRSRIVATNTGTGASRETLTESTGDYTLTLLPPGTYNLSVEAPGFRKLTQNGVILEVDQHARIVRLNGLYRHGFLIAPAVTEAACQVVQALLDDDPAAHAVPASVRWPGMIAAVLDTVAGSPVLH